MIDEFIDYIVKFDNNEYHTKRIEDLAYVKYDRINHQATRVYLTPDMGNENYVNSSIISDILPDYIKVDKDEYILKPIINKDISFPNFVNEERWLKTSNHILLYKYESTVGSYILTYNNIEVMAYLSDGTSNGFDFIYDNTNINLRIIDEL